MKDFNDKIALVTGASRGLGYAVARSLGARGAHVIAAARTVGGLEELDDEIKTSGGQATLVPLDLNDDPALERLGAAIHDRWGRLDIWVHTAIYPAGMTPVEHIDGKDLDRTIATNIRLPQRLIRVLDPLLRRAEAGRAVFFSDPDADEQQFQATYAMSKTAAADMVLRWGGEAAATSSMRVLLAATPPMATAVRARFHPGEDTKGHPTTSEVADKLMVHLAVGAQGRVDLR
ncbi:MAG: SDR family NAD(P)-dependent oxidoreductase [Paracoccaceae bacterium]